LVSPYLGLFSSRAVDPVEKKPLRHWRPGSRIFSLGGLGCTMGCPFCQNHALARPRGRPPLLAVSPEELRDQVRELRLNSVAYTYNEPTVMAEYILAAAPVLKEAGIATVLVSNGQFSAELLNELLPWTAAANIDLKTFDPANYAALGGSLETARANIQKMLAAGIHLELTTLVVPGLSDDPDQFAALVDWVAAQSPDLPLHISRYFPAFRYQAPPTDLELLRRFGRLARTRLRQVHLGNC
jgi:pyruvate formate lyase activating enzyme